MHIIRWFLGKIIAVIDLCFRPKIAPRPENTPADTSNLALYQFANCPFCVKVRWAARRQGLDLALRDAKNDPIHRSALEQGGGKIKTPCLRIAHANGAVDWMYESDDIIAYLQQRFPLAA